jgi:hypothetical protein
MLTEPSLILQEQRKLKVSEKHGKEISLTRMVTGGCYDRKVFDV